MTLEALASGLAVLAFDYAAARVHIANGEAGVLVACGDARAFVAQAIVLVASPGWRSAMRRQGRAAVTRVAWSHVVERFESALTGSPQHAEALASGEREAS